MFADIGLTLTDLSGDSIVMDCPGMFADCSNPIITQNGNVTGTVSGSSVTVSFTGTVGDFEVNGVSWNHGEDANYTYIDLVRNLVPSNNSTLEIEFSSDVYFNSNPGGFGMSMSRSFDGDLTYSAYYADSTTLFSESDLINTPRAVLRDWLVHDGSEWVCLVPRESDISLLLYTF